MKDLVALIDKYRPGYAQTVEPASSIQIEDFEEEAGPLPGAYVRFLRTMGRSIGDFDVHDLHFNVTDLLITYQVAPWIVRDQYLLFGADRGPTGVRYFLDREAPYGADDCMVVMMLGDPDTPRDQCDRLHAGLEEFLYVEAYRTVRLPLFEHEVELAPVPLASDPRSSAEQACEIAERLGFERVAPVRRSALYERGDAAMVLYRHPVSEHFSLRIASSDAAELARTAALFKNAIGVENMRY